MSDLTLTAIAEVNPPARIPKGLPRSAAVSFIPMGDVSESGQWTIKQTRPLNSIAAGFTGFEEGDILVAKITPCMENGKGAHATGLENGIGFGSTEFHVLRARPGSNARLVFHLAHWRGFRHAAEGKMVGSAGQRRVPRSFFDEFPIADLQPAEQSKIALALDILDTAIHETEAIIVKLKAVKQGLLHDLLTRGIDANGELRPPRADAPHLYKQSPLGWIPQEWEVRGVLDVAPTDRQCILTGPFGADLGQADFKEEGVPVLRIGNVQAGYIDWSDTQFVTPEKANRLAKYRVSTGDLLFARQGATTGRNALADEQADGALVNYHIIRVAVDHAKCHPTYLYALFNSASAKSQVDQSKGRGTREGINSEQIASFAFALPKPDEQEEAVARMASIDASISNQSMLLDKLRLEKAGLMDDLLTGRVRVTPLLEGAAP